MLNEFRLAADFVWDRASKRVLEKVTLNEGDANGRKMRVQVVNNGVVENLTGAGLNLAWVGRLGKGLDNFTVVDATKGIFELTFKTGMLNNTGSIKASLQLILPSGSGIVESAPFPMDNRPSLVDSDSAQSTDSWTALETLLVNFENLEAQYTPKLFSLEAQLQQTEQELNAQLAQKANQAELIMKADKSYVDVNLNLKRNKSEKIKSDDLDISSNAFKIKPINVSDELMTMFSPAGSVSPVIPEGGVGTTHYADDSVTSSKRTKLGELGYILSTGGYIDFDFMNNKIIIPTIAFVVYGNQRNQITSGANLEIDIPVGTGSYALYFNSKTTSLTVIDTSINLASVSEHDILLATMRRGYPNSAWTNGKYKVNGKFNTDLVTLEERTKIGNYGMVLSSNGYVDFDFTTNTVTFPGACFIVHQKTNHTLTSSADLKVPFPSATGSYALFFDTANNTFSTPVLGNMSGVTESSILIATIRKGVVNGAWMSGIYKINGNVMGVTPSPPSSNSSRWVGKKANFLGDSITQGSVLPAASTYKLPDVILRELGLTSAINYGAGGTTIGGTSTSAFVNRYTAMSTDADLIFVFGGVNDYALDNTTPFGTMSDRTNETFYGSLHVLIEGLLVRYSKKTIIFMTPIHKIMGGPYPDTKPNPNTGKHLGEYADAIREVCSWYGIPVIDGFHIGLSPNSPQQVIDLFHEKTGGISHPNEEGSDFLGKAIAARLKAL